MWPELSSNLGNGGGVGEARISVSEEYTFNRKHTIFASKAGRLIRNIYMHNA